MEYKNKTSKKKTKKKKQKQICQNRGQDEKSGCLASTVLDYIPEHNQGQKW